MPDSSRDLSLLDWGKAYLKKTRDKPGNVFLGVVHRLDRPVSGILCLAVTSKAAARLSEQIRKREASKTYLAIVNGRPQQDRLTLTNVIKKNHRSNKVEVFASHRADMGKLAITELKVLAQKEGFSLLKLHPLTGRAHQLRAQCAHHDFPILGDVKYGDLIPLKDRSVALHALSLEIRHPTKPKRLYFSCPPANIWPWKMFSSHIPATSEVKVRLITT